MRSKGFGAHESAGGIIPEVKRLASEVTPLAQTAFLPAGLDVRYNVKVPMRDDVELSMDIYSPASGRALSP